GDIDVVTPLGDGLLTAEDYGSEDAEDPFEFLKLYGFDQGDQNPDKVSMPFCDEVEPDHGTVELDDDVRPVTVDALWCLFTADQVTNGSWSEDNARQSKSTASIWSALFPDLDIGLIGTRHGTDFQRTVLNLPALYAKSACWRGRPLREIAEDRQAILRDGDVVRLNRLEISNKGRPVNLKRLSVGTFNRHISALLKFWDWAKRNEYVEKDTVDPFAGLWLEMKDDTSVEEGGRATRPMWNEDQLRALFGSPAYVGCRSHYRRYIAGSRLVRDPFYWLVLIAATTGMRREEIAQLLVGDVKRDRDTSIWYFDLTRRSLKLKNRESRRFVPIPDVTLRFGLIDQLVSGRDTKERLFAQLRPNSKGIFGDAIGKAFGRYRQRIGLDVALLDIHAFRHTVATNLIRAGVPQAHAEEALGHRSEQRRIAFATYDKGATLTLLKAALDRLPTPWLAPALEAARNEES
ncbi:MAG: tyrosine-type recombinase/integrase, partial [Pseudomonadota bacterium]